MITIQDVEVPATRESLLDAIDRFRRLPSPEEDGSELGLRRRDEMLKGLVKRAQILGIYPADTVAANPNGVLDMVHGYGARWFEYKSPLDCRHCHADLRDLSMGPPFKREIGILDRRDRTIAFQCPDCQKEWMR